MKKCRKSLTDGGIKTRKQFQFKRKLLIGLIFCCNLHVVWAQELYWKFSVISVLPVARNIPPEYCLQRIPDSFTAPISDLMQSGVRSNNQFLVKFRSFQPEMNHGLIFTQINAVISRQLDSGHAWYSYWFIQLQQLNSYGVADGVWSTNECKGRLIAEPKSSELP